MNREKYSVKKSGKVLVTGGTGFLGRRLTERLIAEGCPVRVLARRTSNTASLKSLGAEIVIGDLGDKSSIDAAMKGIEAVIHAAAGTSGGRDACQTATVLGTLNILESCKSRKIGKLVYISSCSVYGVADYRAGQLVTEEASLERFPDRRGLYSASKHKAEALVLGEMGTGGFPIVVLRPGTIYGPGGDLFTPMIGFSLRNKAFVVIGNGMFELPLVYIDNLVDAIVKCVQSDAANNQIFNVVDSERINKKQYVEKVIKRLHPKSLIIYFPYSLFYLAVWSQERLLRLLKRSPFLTCYRLISSQRSIRYDNSKLLKILNWQPVISVDKAADKIIAFERCT